MKEKQQISKCMPVLFNSLLKGRECPVFNNLFTVAKITLDGTDIG
jgi:hypothetical protein